MVYRLTYLQSRNKNTDREQPYRHQGRKGIEMNWEFGTDIYMYVHIYIYI